MKTRIASILFGLLAIALFAQSPAQAHGHEKGKKDIVTVAVEAGNFTTLAKALTAAGLVDALKGEGPFTVFAPTDEAFAKLPKGTLESLLKDTEALKNILLYHVVSGSVTSSEVVKLRNATTLSGQSVKVSVKGDKVMIDKSSVTTVDIAASNGVIHIIDEVLIPGT
jgi:uncharacterized surface protein with fasciclin (FAS1) repeats